MMIVNSNTYDAPGIARQHAAPTNGISRRSAEGHRRSVQPPLHDRVTLSSEARQMAARSGATPAEQQLGPEEQQKVNELKKQDAEVKAHEKAHMAAGGGLVQGSAAYTYERGPDNRMYAVGGEVKIDTSAENDPDATIRKMQQVRRAALAPAQPSGTDRAVAAQASQVEAQARVEKSAQEQQLRESGAEATPGASTAPFDVSSSSYPPRLRPSTGSRISISA